MASWTATARTKQKVERKVLAPETVMLRGMSRLYRRVGRDKPEFLVTREAEEMTQLDKTSKGSLLAARSTFTRHGSSVRVSHRPYGTFCRQTNGFTAPFCHRASRARRCASRKPLLENRVSPATEQAIVQMALDEPVWASIRVAEEVGTQGEPISPASVRCIWHRHELERKHKRMNTRSVSIACIALTMRHASCLVFEVSGPQCA